MRRLSAASGSLRCRRCRLAVRPACSAPINSRLCFIRPAAGSACRPHELRKCCAYCLLVQTSAIEDTTPAAACWHITAHWGSLYAVCNRAALALLGPGPEGLQLRLCCSCWHVQLTYPFVLTCAAVPLYYSDIRLHCSQCLQPFIDVAPTTVTQAVRLIFCTYLLWCCGFIARSDHC